MTAPILQVQSLSRIFGGLRAIDDLSFEVGEREFCGVIGPNGAGKTTLLNLITGYLRPSSGAVRLDGHDITGWRPYRLCRLGIARTFQITRPFNEMTVEENIIAGFLFSGRTAGGLGGARASCRELAELVGLDTKLPSLGATLTLGEKKRLELARSLATRPRLLLLDEVMGGLSQREIVDIVHALRRVRATGTTIIMIEHVLHALLQLVERILVLDFGRKIADGAPKAVMEHPDVISSYLGRPMEATP